MQDDNIMPNNGDYFSIQEPLEQRLEKQKERAKILSELPKIEMVVKHLEKRIKSLDKLSSIKVDISEDPALFQKAHEVNRLVKYALEEEKNNLEDLINTYKR
jgi:polyribonucleotide nucleotidyltransferase